MGFLFLSRGLVLGSGCRGGLFLSGCGLGGLVGLALDLRADGLQRLVQRILIFLCGFLLFRCLRLKGRDHCVSDGLGQRVGVDSRSAGRLVLRVLFRYGLAFRLMLRSGVLVKDGGGVVSHAADFLLRPAVCSEPEEMQQCISLAHKALPFRRVVRLAVCI